MPEQDSIPLTDDEALAIRMAKGDEDALHVALQRYGSKVKGFLRRQFGEQLDDSERNYVFQEALIKFWERSAQYDRAKGSLRGWWIRIARNAAIDHIRGEKKFKADELEDLADSSDDEDDVSMPPDSLEMKRLDRIDDFIHHQLKGIEKTVALNCFAIRGDPDSVRLAAKLGKTRGYIDTVKSKVKKKIYEYVLGLEASERMRDEPRR